MRLIPEGQRTGRPFLCFVLHHVGFALAADMPIQADHAIGGAHDYMEIMADHQDRAAGPVANTFDQPIKCRFARLVQPLGRLIKNQKIGIAEKGSGKQDPLGFATGKVDHLSIPHTRKAHHGQRLVTPMTLGGLAQPQKSIDGERQGAIKRKLLRGIADPEVFVPSDRPVAWFDRADQEPKERCLAGSIRADDGHDFRGFDLEIDMIEDALLAISKGEIS